VWTSPISHAASGCGGGVGVSCWQTSP
jgi:hypothetical protein